MKLLNVVRVGFAGIICAGLLAACDHGGFKARKYTRAEIMEFQKKNKKADANVEKDKLASNQDDSMGGGLGDGGPAADTTKVAASVNTGAAQGQGINETAAAETYVDVSEQTKIWIEEAKQHLKEESVEAGKVIQGLSVTQDVAGNMMKLEVKMIALLNEKDARSVTVSSKVENGSDKTFGLASGVADLVIDVKDAKGQTILAEKELVKAQAACAVADCSAVLIRINLASGAVAAIEFSGGKIAATNLGAKATYDVAAETFNFNVQVVNTTVEGDNATLVNGAPVTEATATELNLTPAPSASDAAAASGETAQEKVQTASKSDLQVSVAERKARRARIAKFMAARNKARAEKEAAATAAASTQTQATKKFAGKTKVESLEEYRAKKANEVKSAATEATQIDTIANSEVKVAKKFAGKTKVESLEEYRAKKADEAQAAALNTKSDVKADVETKAAKKFAGKTKVESLEEYRAKKAIDAKTASVAAPAADLSQGPVIVKYKNGVPVEATVYGDSIDNPKKIDLSK